MNTLADYGDESDEESPRRHSYILEQSNGLGEVPSSTTSHENTSLHSPKVRRDSDYSPRPRRDSDAMFDESTPRFSDPDTMFEEPRRYSSFSDNSEHSENIEFREPPPPKRKEYHSPSPSLPTPTSKIPQVSSTVSLVSYSGEEKEDAFERADRDAEKASRITSPPSGIIEPRPPERISQQSDTDDENDERLIDMALEDGRNAMKQIEDISSIGSGGWTPRPYDSPLHGIEQEPDNKRIETPPHQDVTIPPAPIEECDPELVQIFYKHFERKAAGIDVNISVQERKDFQNPSSYEQLILNFGINEVATLLHPRLLTVDYPRCCRYEKIAEDQRRYMDSINAAKNSASSSSSAATKKKA
ncbi:HCNGP-like protein [Dictyocaulus viviparus]|uniref:HCNGP-like protein n=1 Tax=Dictyocaulus viviparus TaxID=29172 RepID=A0A0D8Y6G3_DICVI|nr:HCNGP-like protein [Dictyocaulus viviparus]